MYAAHDSDLKVLKVLLKAGADVRAVDSKGHNVLWYADNRNDEDDKDKIKDALEKRIMAIRYYSGKIFKKIIYILIDK